MERKLYGIVLFFLLLLSHELMIQIEARTCHSRSTHYNGRCFWRNHVRNCNLICKEEKFEYGRCFSGQCYCSRPCEAPKPHHQPPPAAGGGEDPADGGAGGGGGGGGGEGGEGGEGGAAGLV